MRKHGFRSIFSLLVALVMVCSLLPTAAFAEGNLEPTDQVTEQPTNQPEGGEVQQPTEKKEDAPQGEQPASPPQTYTVVYADGAENTVFEAKNFPNLTSGAPTPPFGDDPVREDYTFAGWDPAFAETVTEDVTYTAKWEASGQAAMQSAENSSQEVATYKKPHVDATEDMDAGTRGRYSFNVYIIYHANYPDGNNKTYTVQYEVGRTNDVSKGLVIPVNKLKTYSALGFTKSGYEPLLSESTWYSRSDCTVLRGDFRAYKGDEIHLYAGWKQTVEPDPSTVVLHPTVGSTVTSVKVSVGDKINGYSIIGINGHDITVSLGKYNVNNDTFKLPYAKDIWEGVDNNKVDYISWAGSGSSSRSEGDSALLANGKNTAYYYFKGVPVMPTFTLNYDANGGTGAPSSQTYKATSENEKSHTFTISSQQPTRDGYTFLGWSAASDATTPSYQPSGSIEVSGTTTLYAVWERAKPSDSEIESLLGKQVFIHCVNTDADHKDHGYPLRYELTNVTRVKDGYTCQVWVYAKNGNESYIDEYNATYPNTNHVLDTNSDIGHRMFNLKYDDGGDGWYISDHEYSLPVTFNVKCETVTPPVDNKPGAPSHDELSNLIGNVTVACTNNAATHEPKSKGYALIENSYTTTGVEGDTESGYAYTVTISPEKYVEQFSTDTKVTHTTEDGNATVVLEYKDNAWAVKSGTPVSFNAKCETVTPPTGKPDAPTDEDLKNLDVPPVDVECTTKEEHTASYELLKDSYGIGAVVGNESGSYTCDVTVYAEEYVKEFCKTTYGPHLLDGNDKETLTLKYVDGKWVTDEWVTFKVKCVVPAKPTENDLAGIKVFVQCTNSGATHGDKRKEYGSIGTDGYYYVGNPTFLESDGKYHCTVNVNGERYVAKYSTDTGVQHTYMSVDTVYRYAYLTATWTDGGYVWSVDKDGSTVTFEAWCETVPPAQTFTVTYKDGVAGKAFQDQSYTVPSGSATPAFNGTPYLAGYVFTDWTPAVATTVTANATYIATWKLDTNNNGKPDDEEERYTVTYTDGANGRAFASQVYPGLLSGTSTPKFDGTPVRSGYVFIGWSPVWSGTVTGNVTYTATWSTITGGLDKVPKTGDNGLTLALSALLLFSLCGAAACVISTRKRG